MTSHKTYSPFLLFDSSKIACPKSGGQANLTPTNPSMDNHSNSNFNLDRICEVLDREQQACHEGRLGAPAGQPVCPNSDRDTACKKSSLSAASTISYQNQSRVGGYKHAKPQFSYPSRIANFDEPCVAEESIEKVRNIRESDSLSEYDSLPDESKLIEPPTLMATTKLAKVAYSPTYFSNSLSYSAEELSYLIFEVSRPNSCSHTIGPCLKPELGESSKRRGPPSSAVEFQTPRSSRRELQSLRDLKSEQEYLTSLHMFLKEAD